MSDNSLRFGSDRSVRILGVVHCSFNVLPTRQSLDRGQSLGRFSGLTLETIVTERSPDLIKETHSGCTLIFL